MWAILKVVTEAKGNSQAYALVALRSAILYMSGTNALALLFFPPFPLSLTAHVSRSFHAHFSSSAMDAVLQSPSWLVQLFDLVDSPVVSVSRQTLELLFVICNYREGWRVIHKVEPTHGFTQSHPI